MLQELWDECVELVKDSETIARINGVTSQMRTFSFLFGVKTVFDITEYMKTLQQRSNC